MASKNTNDDQIVFYQSPDGSVNIEVYYAKENIWLTQKKIAELFNVERSVVTKLLNASIVLQVSSVLHKDRQRKKGDPQRK